MTVSDESITCVCFSRELGATALHEASVLDFASLGRCMSLCQGILEAALHESGRSLASAV